MSGTNPFQHTAQGTLNLHAASVVFQTLAAQCLQQCSPYLRCLNSTAVQISLLMLLPVSVDILGDLPDKQIDHWSGAVMRFSLLQAVFAVCCSFSFKLQIKTCQY